MALEIFKLVGSIMVDSASAEESISKTDGKAQGLATSLGNGAKTAAKWGAGIATAAAAAGAAIISATKNMAEDMDVIDKGAQRMKISAESYQELAYAAGLSGVEMSTLERAAKKLEGTDLNLDTALEQIMALGTEEERSAAAAELFGESVAYKMTPLLNAGAEGFEAMKQEAQDLGLIMSGDTVASGAELNDMFSKVSQTFDALGNGLMAEFIPVISEVLGYVIENLPAMQESFHGLLEALKPIIGAIIELLPPIMTALSKVIEWITPVLEAFVDTISALFAGDWAAVWEGVTEVFKNCFEGLKEIFKKPINWIISKLNEFIDGVNAIQIPDWVPKIGGKGLSIAHIPELAKGGILEKGQTGFLEGNGAEAVVPLAQNKAWTKAVAQDMENAMGGSQTTVLLENILGAIRDIDFQVVLDDGTLVGKLAPKMDRALGRLSLNKARGIA